MPENREMLIGSHVSSSGGLLGAAKEAASYGANTFMMYTGAPQNTRRAPLEKMKIDEGRAFMAEHGINAFVVHAPYIINLASWKENTYELAVSFLAEELSRAQALGAGHLVLHPGSFVGRDLAYGTARVIDGLNVVLDGGGPVVCLETMAGKGSEIGGKFEELAAIIDGVKNKERIGVCFDTCHTHDAGYDIVNDLDGVMRQFDEIVGLSLIRVFHLNGSLNERGAKKDRHANIGAGQDNPRGADKIGVEAMRRVARSHYAEGRFLILETPWISDKENLYKHEIALLRAAD